MAAALVGMVCRLSIATKGVGIGKARLLSTCVAAETLRAKLLAAVDADTEAYLEVAGSATCPRAAQRRR